MSNRMVFSVAVVGLGLAGGAILNAGPGSIAAGTGGGGRCVEPGLRFVAGQTASSETVDVPGGIPAGTYNVTLHTHDGYEGRENTDPAGQTSERVEVWGITTSDLEDRVPSADSTTSGQVTFDAPQYSVTVYHKPAGGPDSVIVTGICWTPVPGPTVVETTTTEPATETTAGETTATSGPVVSRDGTTVLAEQTTTTTAKQATTMGTSPKASAIPTNPRYTG